MTHKNRKCLWGHRYTHQSLPQLSMKKPIKRLSLLRSRQMRSLSLSQSRRTHLLNLSDLPRHMSLISLSNLKWRYMKASAQNPSRLTLFSLSPQLPGQRIHRWPLNRLKYNPYR